MTGILLGAAGAYAALCSGAYLLQRSLIYPAPPLPPSTAEWMQSHPGIYGGAQLLVIEGEGATAGRYTYALHLPARDGRPTVVHFHGNGEDVFSAQPLLKAFGERGLGFMVVEYPGYGPLIDQTPREADIYQHAETALVYLQRKLGVTHERTVLQGQSLGSAVALEMAARGFGARLALIAPFTSLSAVAARNAPFLPVRLLLRDRYETLRKAPRVSQPTLVLHGARDAIVPPAMGQKLADALPNAQLRLIEACGHNDLFASGSKQPLQLLLEFALGERPLNMTGDADR